MSLCSSLPELHALLFNDILVLLEKHEDKDKYYFRCHTVENIYGTKGELSPVIRLQECLLRHAAADRGVCVYVLFVSFLCIYVLFILFSPSSGRLDRRQSANMHTS